MDKAPKMPTGLPKFDPDSIVDKDGFVTFAKQFYAEYEKLSKDQQKSLEVFVTSLTGLIKSVKKDESALTPDALKTLSASYPDADPKAKSTVSIEKVDFGGTEMTPEQLQQQINDTKEALKTSLRKINRKHLGDAYRKEKNGGIPGYTALYGNLKSLENIVERIENGEIVSASKVESIYKEYIDNLNKIKKAVEAKKSGAPAPKSPDGTPDAIKAQKDDLLAKIEAADEASVAFTPTVEGVYALTKERRKAAVERAYRAYQRNQSEIAKLPDSDKGDATAKAEALFNESVRLADPDNTEVVDKLSAHQETVRDHKAAEAEYQTAFKAAIAAGKKDVEGVDIDKKTNAQNTLKTRIAAEEEAFKVMSALRGMEFSADSVRTGVASRRYLNAARSQKQLENQERLNNAGPAKKVFNKAGKILSLPLHYGGKINQYFDNKLKAKIDTKVNAMSEDKLDGEKSDVVHDLEIRKAQTAERLFKRNKFFRTWAIKTGVVLVYGAAGAATGGLAAGGVLAALTGARVLGGTAGAAAGAGISNTFDYLFKKTKSKNYSSMRESIKAGGAAPDKLTADLDKVIKAEQRILTNKKAKGAVMFAGALTGGLSASMASSDIIDLSNPSTPRTPTSPAGIKSPDEFQYQHQDEVANNKVSREIKSPDDFQYEHQDKIVEATSNNGTDETVELESTQGGQESLSESELAAFAELEQKVAELQKLIEMQAKVNEAQAAEIGTLEALHETPAATEKASVKLSLDNLLDYNKQFAGEDTITEPLQKDGDYSLWRIAKGDLVDSSRVLVPIAQPEIFAQVETTLGVDARNSLIVKVVEEIERNPEAREALGMKVDQNPNEWLYEGDKINVSAYDRLARIVAVREGILPASVLEIEITSGVEPTSLASVDIASAQSETETAKVPGTSGASTPQDIQATVPKVDMNASVVPEMTPQVGYEKFESNQFGADKKTVAEAYADNPPVDTSRSDNINEPVAISENPNEVQSLAESTIEMESPAAPAGLTDEEVINEHKALGVGTVTEIERDESGKIIGVYYEGKVNLPKIHQAFTSSDIFLAYEGNENTPDVAKVTFDYTSGKIIADYESRERLTLNLKEGDRVTFDFGRTPDNTRIDEALKSSSRPMPKPDLPPQTPLTATSLSPDIVMTQPDSINVSSESDELLAYARNNTMIEQSPEVTIPEVDKSIPPFVETLLADTDPVLREKILNEWTTRMSDPENLKNRYLTEADVEQGFSVIRDRVLLEQGLDNIPKYGHKAPTESFMGTSMKWSEIDELWQYPYFADNFGEYRTFIESLSKHDLLIDEKDMQTNIEMAIRDGNLKIDKDGVEINSKNKLGIDRRPTIIRFRL